MIKANELRMGNLIEKDNVIYKFLSLEQNHASTSEYRWYWVETLDEKLGKYYSTYFKPIPLAPEILEKCGFASNPYQDRYELGDIHIEYCGVRNLCWIDGKHHIQYLHQLQNFVYVNTNTELTYNP